METTFNVQTCCAQSMKAIALYSIAVENYNIYSMIRILAQVTHWEVALLALPYTNNKIIDNDFGTKIEIENIQLF